MLTMKMLAAVPRHRGPDALICFCGDKCRRFDSDHRLLPIAERQSSASRKGLLLDQCFEHRPEFSFLYDLRGLEFRIEALIGDDVVLIAVDTDLLAPAARADLPCSAARSAACLSRSIS